MLLDSLLTALREAQHVCVLTGAGISAESGVPTFRDAQSGLWAKYDPLDLATPEAFLRDPELIWRWYRWRRELVAKAEPNPGHLALVKLAQLVPRFTLVTQNVDGLHQRAGSTDVIEFHGNLFADRCFVEGCIVDPSTDETEEAVPVCAGCGGHLRPGVVWSGLARPFPSMPSTTHSPQPLTVTYFCQSAHLRWSIPLQAWPKSQKTTAQPSPRSILNLPGRQPVSITQSLQKLVR